MASLYHMRAVTVCNNHIQKPEVRSQKPEKVWRVRDHSDPFPVNPQFWLPASVLFFRLGLACGLKPRGPAALERPNPFEPVF
jgi:hypothetical protein